MKNWQNYFEAFCSAPSIILDQIVSSWHEFWIEEKELAENGEFDPETTE